MFSSAILRWLDDDFGKDFFDSWKSEKLGNVSMDFDVETVPKNKKASFKFDELDNFELSGNFDKLSSFNLDMPDLDFSGPPKKNEKINEKSSKEFFTGMKGAKESKDDKFSFDFDFNSFDLDSKSLEGKGPTKFSDKNVQEHSSKHEKNQESSDKNFANTNITRDQHSDLAHKTEASIGKRAVFPGENVKKSCVTMARREHSHGNYLAKENSDNNQYFSLQSFSGDGSADVALPEIQTNGAPLEVAKPRLTTAEKHKSIQSISSSPSSSSSPVDSFNSGCWTKSTEKELLKPGSELQKHLSHEPVTGISGLTGSTQIRNDAYNSTGPKKSIEGVNKIDEKQSSCQNLPLQAKKQNSHQNFMLPLLKSDITTGGSTKLRGIMSTGLQLNTIAKLGDNMPQQLPASLSKPFNSTMETRTKTAHASTTIVSRFEFKASSESHQASVGTKKKEDPSLQKLISDATAGPKESSAGSKTSPVKENAIAKLVSSNQLGSQIVKSNKMGATLDDNNHHGILGSAIAKTMEINKDKPNSSKPREAKSVRFLEKRMESPLNSSFKTANIEMKSSLHATLKRKIDEQSVANMETSNPLKGAKESNACRRMAFEASPIINRKTVPEIKIPETQKDAIPVANQASLTVASEAKDAETGVVSLSIVEDNNLRKAETLTKELDNICNTMRKKHEETKELQLRSIINNNELLLLNFHMLEEKIQALQKFTSNLLLMEL